MQFTHVPLLTAPNTVEYVPLVQLLHAVDPDREYEPATHLWQAFQESLSVEPRHHAPALSKASSWPGSA